MLQLHAGDITEIKLDRGLGMVTCQEREISRSPYRWCREKKRRSKGEHVKLKEEAVEIWQEFSVFHRMGPLDAVKILGSKGVWRIILGLCKARMSEKWFREDLWPVREGRTLHEERGPRQHWCLVLFSSSLPINFGSGLSISWSWKPCPVSWVPHLE